MKVLKLWILWVHLKLWLVAIKQWKIRLRGGFPADLSMKLLYGDIGWTTRCWLTFLEDIVSILDSPISGKGLIRLVYLNLDKLVETAPKKNPKIFFTEYTKYIFVNYIISLYMLKQAGSKAAMNTSSPTQFAEKFLPIFLEI